MTKYIIEYDGLSIMDKEGRDKIKELVTQYNNIVKQIENIATGGTVDLTDYAKKSELPKTATDVGADASGTATSKVTEHNSSSTSHNDIRGLITNLTSRLNTLADSDDTTLDQLSEIVSYIKNNKSLIDGITTNKVNVSDIINNLTTNASNKPLSASQGVALKSLIDAITVPTKVSQLTNDSKYVTETTLNNKGYITTIPTIPTKTSQLTNDSNFITESVLNSKGYITADDIPSSSGSTNYTDEEKAKVTRLTSEKISILSFGAKGDGTTDNSTAIQNAIDSVTTGDRATIYITDGIYCINTPIKLKKEITIKGNGIGSVIKEGSNFSGDALLYTEDSSTAHTNVIVRDLELRGLKNKTVSGVKFNCVYWGTVQNCRIIDLGGNGVELVGNSAVTETCYVTNNLILYCLKNGVFTNGNSRDIHISGGDIGCHGGYGVLLNALSSTITGVQAIWGNGSDGVYEAGENNQIRTSNIEGNVGFGVYCAGKKLMLTGCKFTANKVNEASPNGQVGVDNTATKTFISDCTFLNNVDPGKPVFNYSIANYGTDTTIGCNYYESTEKVLSSKSYTIANFQTVSG